MANKPEIPLSIFTATLDTIKEQSSQTSVIHHQRSQTIVLSPISKTKKLKSKRSRSNTAHTVHYSYSNGVIHPLHTIDDMTLLETVRDLIDEHEEYIAPKTPKPISYANTTSPRSRASSRQKYLKRQERQRKLTYCDKYEDAVFSALDIDKSNPSLRRRVSAIIHTIESQDSFSREYSLSDDDDDDENKEEKHQSYESKIDVLSMDDLEDLMTPTAEKQRQLDVKKKMATKQYTDLKQKFNKKMEEILKRSDGKCKTKKDLYTECSSFDHEIEKCPCLNRLLILMHAHKSVTDTTLWQVVPIQPLIDYNDVYDYQQVVNDFLHLKHHIEINQELAAQICRIFGEEIQCENLAKCLSFQRHYRDRTDIKEQKKIYYRRAQDDTSKRSNIMNNKDIVFQQECDKIHSFLLHSLIGFDDTNEEDANERLEDIVHVAKGRSFTVSPPNSLPNSPLTPHTPISPQPQPSYNPKMSLTYIGKQEDEKWWKQIDTIKDKDDDHDEKIYKLLAQKMGVFRYQSSHGFRTGQYHGLSHLKARYNNVKEEALRNEFHSIQNDDWNQTLRKAKAFYNSWNKARIRSQYDGVYNDQISGHSVKWKVGEEIKMTEVVILKLYTDFDKLQFELKKCFRWETIFDLFSHIEQEQIDEKMDSNEIKNENEKKQELEKRLCQFFHWRLGLLALLNKFGQQMKASSNNQSAQKQLELYHGVNAKMILNPAETLAFSGPLSTTSSYHVARTFATKKGMVLKITSQFPRLNKCRAFDVSPLSDYPEEQEYLIGDIYMRLLQVSTRTLMTSWDDFDKMRNVPLASFTRAVFFVVHVFREQIFSMSENLENFLAMFVELHLDVKKLKMKRNKDQRQSQRHGEWLKKQVFGKNPGVGDDYRRRKILKILWQKFNLFRCEPNLKQIIKIDRVSDKLKAYFFDDLDIVNIKTNKKRYAVSFEKIINIFENVQEIHFINEYKFDDDIMRKLVNQIKKKENKLRCVKFLYYDYVDNRNKNTPSLPDNSNRFLNPDQLNKVTLSELDNLGWKLTPKKNGKVGYKINIVKTREIDANYD